MRQHVNKTMSRLWWCRNLTSEASHSMVGWNSIFKIWIRGLGARSHIDLPSWGNRKEHGKYFTTVNTSARQSEKRSSFYLSCKRNLSSQTIEQKSSPLEIICNVLRRSHQLSHDQMTETFNDLAIGWNPDLVKDVVQNLKDPEIALKFFYWVDNQRGYKHSHITYNAIIEILGSARRFEEVEMLLDTMSHSGCNITAATYTIMIRSYGKAGKVAAANALLLEMSQHHGYDLEALNCLLEAHVQNQGLESALCMYNKMQHFRLYPNEFTISILTRGLCVAGRLEEAQKLVSEASIISTVAYNELINGLCKNGKLNEGYTVLNQMTEKGLVPDIYTYNTLIVRNCQANEFGMSAQLFDEMVEKGITPDSVTFGTLVTVMVCMCQRKESFDALKLLDKVATAGYHFTYSQWVALVRAFRQTVVKDEARKVLRGMPMI